MTKKYLVLALLILALVITGCTPNQKNDTEVVQNTEEEAKTVVIPSIQLDETYYRTLMPYEESASRGLVVSNLNTKYDMKEVELGLFRISQTEFSPDKYMFQEGQYLKGDTLKSWLAREGQTKDGLNPNAEGLTGEEKALKAPVYITHIVEQNYLEVVDNKARLAGVSVGLSLNSIYYYTKEEYGAEYEQALTDEQIKQNGERIAKEVVSRMRKIAGLEEVPIVVGLFKQNSNNAIVPGTYFEYGVASKGGNLSDWKPINEEYIMFPSSDAEKKYRDLNTIFSNFKRDVEEYFSNYTSVIGTGYFKDQQLQKLTIEIPIQFFGSAELIGFTQQLAGYMKANFDASMNVEIQVNSLDGAEALLVKEAGEEDAFVHIYNH
ncbi:CamS family sex pheromone protein [Psychrobacillus sp. FSL W7-1457]|uniref:CamS family sex pheromone protein n=1 Tax=Psychrobacillus sp. FSL W7-1457 TaxID=2954547 RepID=UPI00315A7A84